MIIWLSQKFLPQKIKIHLEKQNASKIDQNSLNIEQSGLNGELIGLKIRLTP